jgi:hypothetical protein
MCKKIVGVKVSRINELEIQLKELRMEHNIAIQDLHRKIREAMKVRVIEIDFQLTKIFSVNRKKMYSSLKKRIRKLESEKFDLECCIYGVC